MKTIQKNNATILVGETHYIINEGPALDQEQGWEQASECLLNTSLLKQKNELQKIGEYRHSNGGTTDTNSTFSGDETILVSVVDTSKVACVVLSDYYQFSTPSQYTEERPKQIHWYFPEKNKWVTLGMKRSYELLRQHGGIIPQWLEDAVKGYPTKGNGWALIN